jgi:hypothetical protein
MYWSTSARKTKRTAPISESNRGRVSATTVRGGSKSKFDLLVSPGDTERMKDALRLIGLAASGGETADHIPAKGDFEDLWRQRQHARAGGGELPIPGDADLIRYLGAHAAAQAWERWKWAGDLMALYQRAATLDLLEQRRVTRNEGWGDLFDCALLITSAITGWELPADLRGTCGWN